MDVYISSSCEETNMQDLEVSGDDKNHVANEECGDLKCQSGNDVDGDGAPRIGMTFGTTKEAYDFYNMYARRVGFSVRILRTNHSRKDKDKILRQALVCSCEGTSKKIKTPQKKREIRRFDCKAIFVIKHVSSNKYRLIEFKSEHTHDLVPLEHSHLIRSQRKIEFSQEGLMKKMRSSGIKQGQIFSYMCEEAGGAQNLNFTRSDCKNLLQRTRSEFFKKGDAECLLQYFKQKQSENKNFFYSFRTHEDGEICGVFFCDAKSRRDYALFGDAICFDTTFRTNNYDMLCAPIVGVNNHGQTTLFGCGLIDGETIEAITWLFSTFLEAMGGKKPSSIFTDQSKAISRVVEKFFPNAHHGLCLWHLCQNAAKNLANNGYKSFASMFKDCIYNPETVDEFEISWNKLLEDNGLRDNAWLCKTYELREKWAQVYSRAHFCAGMTTSQRSESINKFLKDYFGHGRIVLREFVGLYTRAMDNRREKEREASHLTQQTSPILICSWSVEREAAKKYTKKAFYWFQESIKQTIDLSLELENDNGSSCTYLVKEIEGRNRVHKVSYNHLDKIVSCTCRKFEFEGILCSHILKLFRHLEFKSLPPQYYMKRWTREATHEVVCNPMGEIIPDDNDPIQTTHYSELSHISQRIVSKGSKSVRDFLLSKTLLLEVEAKINAFVDSNEIKNQNNIVGHLTSTSNMQNEQQLKDPTKRCSKSQSSKRIKSALETKTRKKSLPKVVDGKNDNEDVTCEIIGRASNSSRDLDEGIFGMAQQAYYNNNTCQHMNLGGMFRQTSTPPQVTLQTCNIALSQQREFLSKESFISQEATSSQVFACPIISRSQELSTSLALNFTR